jgi:hypothetical protein
MKNTKELWESYYWHNTTILKNKLNIKDQEKLDKAVASALLTSAIVNCLDESGDPQVNTLAYIIYDIDQLLNDRYFYPSHYFKDVDNIV